MKTSVSAYTAVSLLVLAMAFIGCGEAIDSEDPSEPEQDTSDAPALCDWARTEGCDLCSDHRDYGTSNTCAGVVWRGRSATDFCLQTFPCDAPPQPVTRIDEPEQG